MADMQRYNIEYEENWKKWCKEIPKLKFESDWEVKIIPPFGGAMVRFTIDYNGNHVSVYLDVNDSLGCMGEPYWEIYDGKEEPQRFSMYDTDELMNGINELLNKTNEESEEK